MFRSVRASLLITLLHSRSDPVAGSIKLDGVEIRDLNVGWLRNQIGLVSQVRLNSLPSRPTNY